VKNKKGGVWVVGTGLVRWAVE